MAESLSLYEFDKRKNSTKTPTGTPSASLSVNLKVETSLNNPTFLVSSKPPFGVNYCEYEGAYYWIDDISLNTRDLWELRCTIDPLATFSSTIKASRAYIEYSSAVNSRIFDPRPAKLGQASIAQASGTVYQNISDSGSMIVVVSGDETAGAYKLLNQSPEDLLNGVYHWWETFDTTDIMNSLKNLAKFIVSGDVAQNLRDVRWIPWDITGLGLHTIHLGLYDTQVDAQKIIVGGSHSGFTSSISIPWQSAPIWKRNSQYMTVVLYAPFIGNISLPVEQLCGASSIVISGCVDEGTGDISVIISDNRGEIYGTYGAATGVSVPVGGAGFTPRAAMSAIAGVGIGAAGASIGIANIAGGVAAGSGGASTMLASSGSNLLSIAPSSTCVGGLQGASAVGLPMTPTVTTALWDSSDSESNLAPIIGNPTFKVDTIGNYSYVLTRQASISGIARGIVLDIINDYLAGGVYVE